MLNPTIEQVTERTAERMRAENAALVDFDFDVLQDEIFDGIRKLLGENSTALDIARFQDSDPAQRRY